jgi:hypothetical protein
MSSTCITLAQCLYCYRELDIEGLHHELPPSRSCTYEDEAVMLLCVDDYLDPGLRPQPPTAAHEAVQRLMC